MAWVGWAFRDLGLSVTGPGEGPRPARTFWCGGRCLQGGGVCLLAGGEDWDVQCLPG